MASRPLAAALAALALAACSSHRIPGTDIRDTADTRAIVDVIDRYRQAAERRDAEAVLALVSPTYYDDAGTADPSDDQDYEQLRRSLPQHFRQLTAIRLGIGVRAIDVQGDRATANVFYDGRYRVATPTGEAAKLASDVTQMRFVREGGAWHIAGGL
jgi:ketosteroid isomerase-like protein